MIRNSSKRLFSFSSVFCSGLRSGLGLQAYSRSRQYPWLLVILCGALVSACTSNSADPTPRAQVLAQSLDESSALKHLLLQCDASGFERTPFSIAHRGAPLGYPEHTRESYEAAAQMGAGLIECDVTFTKDLELVCRHSQCDLHRTTNILQSPLAAACTSPFTPASEGQIANAKCCTSDITLAQFRTLRGRSDFVDPTARTINGYLAARPSPVAPEQINQPGTLLTHRESIELIDGLGADFVPELKRPEVEMPFAPGFDQEVYLAKMLGEYEEAGINPARVHPQSFDLRDIQRIIARHPEYAEQAVYLDPRGRDPGFQPNADDMAALYASGVRVLAPPIPMLLTLGVDGRPVPSDYARFAKDAGLRLVTWTFEAGRADDSDNWMYASVADFMTHESNMLEVLHVLATEVGVQGIFSDWPGTVTFYANCSGR